MQRWLMPLAVALPLVFGCLGCRDGTRRPDPSADRDETHGQGEKTPDETSTQPTRRWLIAPICIDAGHGGRDSGTPGGDGIDEKTLTLDLALRVKRGLEANGGTVVMTRRDDRFVSLDRRVQTCNASGAEFLLSIHANGFSLPAVHGFELYYLGDEAEPDARRAAECIRTAIAADIEARDRGVRAADFAVLARTDCPAVLIEVGYLTNPAESARLGDESYRQRLADAIVVGIVAFGSERVDDAGADPLKGEDE